METHCPLCGDEKRFARKRMPLYGHPVCKKCYYAFANRRQVAFLIDLFAYRAFVFASAFLLGWGMVQANPEVTVSELEDAGVILSLVLLPVFLLRDAIRGRSIGKILLGVRTIDEKSGAASGVKASILRGLPLLIPLVPLIVAAQLNKGHRWGDRWAGTRVIWEKHADSPVFATAAGLGKVFE